MLVRSFLLMLTISVGVNSFAAEIPWDPANDQDISQMKCNNLKSPSDEQMLSFLESQISDPSIQFSNIEGSFGFKFKNENPQMVEWFNQLHRPEIPGGDPISKSEINRILPNRSCENVICALEKNYGAGSALKMLYLLVKFGVSTSPLHGMVTKNYDKWDVDYLDDIIVGLEALPPHLLPLKETRVLRFKKGYVFESYGDSAEYVLANARMDVFDRWERQTRMMRIQTIIHELGHATLGAEYGDAKIWTQLPPTKVSAYAQTNSREDFAESFVAYRVVPHYLKKVSPERYQFMKKFVFKNLEYNSGSQCEKAYQEYRNQTGLNTKLRRQHTEQIKLNQNQLINEINRQVKMGSFNEVLMQQCQVALLHTPSMSKNTEIDQCIATTLKKRAFIVSQRSFGNEDADFQNIRASDLENLTVDKVFVNFARNQMRDSVIKQLVEFYNDNYLDLTSSENLDRDLKYATRQGLIKHYWNVFEPMLKAEKLRRDQLSFFKKLFNPNFQPYFR